ncbi:hypothetical protein H0X06_06240 [Candidatus Dependentiae bacterium]|nr:hypothetical protein [Candidatus Dependentiae bacterium]
MKKNILLSLYLTGLSTSYALAMNRIALEEPVPQLQASEIKSKIAGFLIEAPTAREAIRNLTAFLRTDTESLELLKNYKSLTRDLIDYMLWHYDDFEKPMLSKLHSVLCEEELTCYKESIDKGDTIRMTLLNQRSALLLGQQWEIADTWNFILQVLNNFTLLSESDKTRFYQIVNYCWKETTSDLLNPILNKNILIESLLCDAPLEIISLLIKHGAQVNVFRSGPSPFFIVIHKLLTCTEEEKKEELQKKLDLLLKAGAFPHHCFIVKRELKYRNGRDSGSVIRQTQVTPFLEALRHKNIQIARYLFDVGACSLPSDALVQAAEVYVQGDNDIFLEIFKAILTLKWDFTIPCVLTETPPLDQIVFREWNNCSPGMLQRLKSVIDLLKGNLETNINA